MSSLFKRQGNVVCVCTNLEYMTWVSVAALIQVKSKSQGSEGFTISALSRLRHLVWIKKISMKNSLAGSFFQSRQTFCTCRTDKCENSRVSVWKKSKFTVTWKGKLISRNYWKDVSLILVADFTLQHRFSAGSVLTLDPFIHSNAVHQKCKNRLRVTVTCKVQWSACGQLYWLELKHTWQLKEGFIFLTGCYCLLVLGLGCQELSWWSCRLRTWGSVVRFLATCGAVLGRNTKNT